MRRRARHHVSAINLLCSSVLLHQRHQNLILLGIGHRIAYFFPLNFVLRSYYMPKTADSTTSSCLHKEFRNVFDPRDFDRLQVRYAALNAELPTSDVFSK
jgi:hypothetical protein